MWKLESGRVGVTAVTWCWFGVEVCHRAPRYRLLCTVWEGSSLLHPTWTLPDGWRGRISFWSQIWQQFSSGCVSRTYKAGKAVAYTASIPCLVNFNFKGRENPEAKLQNKKQSNFLCDSLMVAPRNSFALLYWHSPQGLILQTIFILFENIPTSLYYPWEYLPALAWWLLFPGDLGVIASCLISYTKSHS